VTRAWVVGSGGLLGSSVARRFDAWSPGARFSWDSPSTLEAELGAAAEAYLRAAPDPWTVLWCAGTGIVGTTADAMARETRALEVLLDRLGAAAGSRPGVVFLASTAGGLYSGSRRIPITEETPVEPTSDYGRAKLRQEELLASWASSRPSVSTLVGRLSNLYGPDQNLSKPQGLIAYLSRCLLHQVPAHVFAPLDTLRDYLYAPDAADQIHRAVERLRRLPPPARVTKILASGQTVSIGAILAIFLRIAKRRPRIVCSASPLSALQPGRLPLKSTVWTDLPLAPSTPLPSGIQSVYRRHLELFQAGRLAFPSPRS
jgi:UDP-glucose 4-epimerase